MNWYISIYCCVEEIQGQEWGWGLRKLFQTEEKRSSHCGSVVMKPTSICEDVGSVPGLEAGIPHCCSCVGSYSSFWPLAWKLPYSAGAALKKKKKKKERQACNGVEAAEVVRRGQVQELFWRQRYLLNKIVALSLCIYYCRSYVKLAFLTHPLFLFWMFIFWY